MNAVWTKVEDWPVKPGVDVLLGNREWIDAEVNADGVMIGYYERSGPNNGAWIASIWNHKLQRWDAGTVTPEFVMAITPLPGK